MPPKKNTEQFIALARERHGNRYDYSKVVYVIIICLSHGDFMQAPGVHMDGHGCQICGYIQSSISNSCTTKEFIERAILVHSGKYTYEEVKYIATHIHVIITCGKHGKFTQTPLNHLQGQGCSKCGHEKLNKYNVTNTEEFVLKAQEKHGHIYDYKNSIYSNCNTPLEIICIIHGLFYQKPSGHLSGSGCKFCKNKTEGKLNRWIKANNFVVEYQKKFEWCKNINYLSFDFYLPELNLIIELDGNQHFFQVSNWKSPEETQLTDNFKMRLANQHGLSVIRIYQPDVWCDKNNWQEHLLNTIKKYDTPTNICIGNIYEQCYDTQLISSIIYELIEEVDDVIPYPSNLNDLVLCFESLTMNSSAVFRFDESAKFQLEFI